MMTRDVAATHDGQPAPETQPARRPLKMFVLLLCFLTIAMIFATGLMEWFFANTSGGEREESDFGIALAFALIAVVGALAVMGQPRNAVGWVLLFSALFAGLAGLGEGLSYYFRETRPDETLIFVLAWLANIGWMSGIALLLLVFPFLFPDGRLPGRRWRIIFTIVLAYTGLVIGIVVFSPLVSPRYLDPTGVESLLSPFFALFPFIGFLGVGSLVDRYRRSGTTVRQQMKWLVLTMGTAIVAFLLVGLIEDQFNVIFSNTVWGIVYLLIPAGLSISLLRYRLFDVDTVIRKTALYTILTVFLALVYFGIVIILQRLLSPLTGESTVAIVLSTLAIAALFLPLRRRVQAFIDRRFYRRKYNAEQVLARFAATARDETDLDALTAELLRVIQETMEPEHVSVWLKPAANQKDHGPQTTDRHKA